MLCRAPGHGISGEVKGHTLLAHAESGARIFWRGGPERSLPRP